MDGTVVKSEPVQRQFSQIPETNTHWVHRNRESQNDASSAERNHETRLSAPDFSSQAWGTRLNTKVPSTFTGPAARSPASSNSSEATHISAGSALNPSNPSLPTPAATVQEDVERSYGPSATPKVGIESKQPLSDTITVRRTEKATSSPSHMSKLPSAQPITFDASPLPSLNVPPPSSQAQESPIKKSTRGEDPLPPHLRTMLHEYYKQSGSSDLPPCGLVSDNRQSLFIFPGGKRAKYVNRNGGQVTFRRVQLPESGHWVSIIDGPDQPAVFVKRLPKVGQSPSFTGTALFVWNGVKGFDANPSFFKIPIEDGKVPEHLLHVESNADQHMSKRPRLSEPYGDRRAATVGLDSDRRPLQGAFTATPPQWTYGWGLPYPNVNDPTRTTPVPLAPAPSTPTPGMPKLDGTPSLPAPPQWQQTPPMAPNPFGTAPPLPRDVTPFQSRESVEPRWSSTQSLNNVRASEAPSNLASILSPEQKAHTIVSFVGGSRPRSRPFTLCDTVEKFFVQAAAAGFKNFSLSAVTFVMVKIWTKGLPKDDSSTQELAVVKDDELDFQQLQEVIREVGKWQGPGGPAGVECEVTVID